MKVLIVVDMQNDFIDGALGTKKKRLLLYLTLLRLLRALKERFYTRKTHILMITWIRKKEKICRCHIASKEPTVGIWQRISRR